MNYKKISRSSPQYPPKLLEIFQPPEHLYAMGDISAAQKPCLAIVGTRKYSPYGESITKQIVQDLAGFNISIVSGLAKGIDAFAHQAALDVGLSTVAVLGSGFEHIYPKANHKLAQRILEAGGLILSEYKPATPPKAYNFPARNRIISGISYATLVIEAPYKSGALITARFALEQGRDIYVVPGDVDRPNSQGTLNLLQKGAAYPVRNGLEIIQLLKGLPQLKLEFNASAKQQEKQQSLIPLSVPESKIISALSKFRAKGLPFIQEKTSLSTSEILANLTFLEIKGLVKTRGSGFLLTSDQSH